MSNHLHVVLLVDIDNANRWTEREVLGLWHKLFKGDKLTHKFSKCELVEAHEVARLKHTIAIYVTLVCSCAVKGFNARF
ncbi:hypothetical protein CKQ84_11060 [Shewanella sp. WE21]|nr:hypothetical protein CKQ84_11060 [Shewanella sp. WE21]